MAEKKYHPKFAIYKPTNNFKGSAAQLEISDKESGPQLFMVFAKQVDGKDNNGNFKFDWNKDSTITVKLGETDVGELLAVLSGLKESLGQGKGLYHQIPNSTENKSLDLKLATAKNNDGTVIKQGYYLSVSSQKEKGGAVNRISMRLTLGEGCIMLNLLNTYITKVYKWYQVL